MSSYSPQRSASSSRSPTPINQSSRSPLPSNGSKHVNYLYIVIFSFFAPISLLLIGLIDFNPYIFTILIIFYVLYNIFFFTSNFYVNKGGYPSSMYKFLSANKSHDFIYFVIIGLLVFIPFIALIILKFIIHPAYFALLLIVFIFHFDSLFYGQYPFLH